MTVPSTATLVIHAGAIGDFLLMCPSLAPLGAAGPVDVAGQFDRVQLAVAGGLARAAYDLDAIGFSSVFSEPNDQLRRALARYDHAVVWMRDDGLIRQRLTEVGIADVRAFPGLPPSEWTAHASDYFLECVGGERGRLPSPLLSIPPAAIQRDVVIHCGSGGEQKNWPIKRFEALSRALDERGRAVTWCTGPAEDSIQLPSGVESLRTLDLTEVAALLAASRLYIGNDSGISHLAAAVGCPAVVIFGPTNPRVWAPRGPRVSVVQRDPWPSVDDALQAVDSMTETQR